MLAQWVAVAAAVWRGGSAGCRAGADARHRARARRRLCRRVSSPALGYRRRRAGTSAVSGRHSPCDARGMRVARAAGRAPRELKSDLLLLKPAGADAWMAFRDVFEVDGEPVRDRTERLSQLFLERTPSTDAQIRTHPRRELALQHRRHPAERQHADSIRCCSWRRRTSSASSSSRRKTAGRDRAGEPGAQTAPSASRPRSG